VKTAADKRPYRMTARAAAVAATRARILEAAVECFMGFWYEEVGLAAVAERAGVSTQTVINHFGSKEALAEAAYTERIRRIESRRFAPEAGDLPALVSALVDDYEELGDAMVRVLAAEDRVPGVRRQIAEGREGHRRWCRDKLGASEEALPTVVAAADVYMWKLLRRDQGLSRAATEDAMLRLVRAALRGGT